jgi:hypothetical protein
LSQCVEKSVAKKRDHQCADNPNGGSKNFAAICSRVSKRPDETHDEQNRSSAKQKKIYPGEIPRDRKTSE